MAKRKAKAIMLQGTGSDVGKTVLVAGLCRLARNRGLKVRPFKPQNMSNNAAVADVPLADGSGGEIGRAQWLQALACGVPSRRIWCISGVSARRGLFRRPSHRPCG